MTEKVRQWQTTTRSIRSNVFVIPPLAKEFIVYGSRETVERARKWALRNRLVLIEGVPTCAHGLYGVTSCVGQCGDHSLDHTNIWASGNLSHLERPFLLTQPYVEEVPDDLIAYGKEHGLKVSSRPSDGWYGLGTLPIRLQVDYDKPLFPIEYDVYAKLVAYPVRWPDDELKLEDDEVGG